MSDEWVTDKAAQNARLRDELVHMARLGARGDAERVRIQAMRFIRMLRNAGDSLAETLQAAVFAADGSVDADVSRAVRRAPPSGISKPVPTDLESRLELLRVDDPPTLPHQLVQDGTVLRRLDQLVLERNSQRRLAKFGLDAPKAIIFTGPPGVGKTMAAKHLAIQMNVPLLTLDLATVMSSYLGKSGGNIKQAFSYARNHPCILFVDEMDAIAKKRDDDGDIGELKRLVTVLLQEIDLWTPKNLLVAATNHAKLLDTAVLRRFDDAITFPRPTYDNLCTLAKAIVLKNDPVPEKWVNIIAVLNANTSHSRFVRRLNRLRRSWALGGREAAKVTLRELASDSVASLSKDERKQLGIFLTDEVGISQRDASNIVGIARETLRTAQKQENENG